MTTTKNRSDAYGQMTVRHDLGQFFIQPFLDVGVGSEVSEGESEGMRRGLVAGEGKDEGVSAEAQVIFVSFRVTSPPSP